jgi:hypothetical protein
MALTNSQREALKLLADSADRCAVPIMLNHGCGIAALIITRWMSCRLVVMDRMRELGSNRSLSAISSMRANRTSGLPLA